MKQSKPHIIGLTGTIASGKSECSSYLHEKYDIPVVDADKIAYSVCDKGSEGLEKIKEVFGEAYVNEDGTYNRELMTKTVSEDKNKLDLLNQTLHPIIKKEREKQFEQYKDKEIILYDCPLLFEAQEDENVDEILLITTTHETILDRLRDRNGMSESEAKKRVAMMGKENDKLEKADVIIYNTGTIEDLHATLDDFINDLKER